MDYQDCIKEISINLAFESYKGIIGNSYATEAGKILSEINPLNIKDEKTSSKPHPTLNMMRNFGLM